jgi:hypothetical protein
MTVGRMMLKTIAPLLLLATVACASENLDPIGSGGGGGEGGAPVMPGPPFSLPLFDRARISSNGDDPNFHNVIAPIDLTGGPYASATLVIDLDSTCYPFESWENNPPPAGHNWPADCDAFDRNYEWTLDDPEEEGNGQPPGIELVRAITPFGGPSHFEIDVTDVMNGVSQGSHRVRAHITTYSDGEGIVSGSNGGWFVSGRIDLVPGTAPRNVLAVVPIYNKSYGPADAPGAQRFTVPEGTVASRIEYRVTGHGGGNGGLGCVGPAEEFCDREHKLQLDGAEVAAFHPWRTDCATWCTITHYDNGNGGGFDYCLENPCGAIASVQAPRANWCPSQMTPPFVLEPALGVGEHTMSWQVSAIAEGGSWRTSATYFAFGAPQ